MVDETTRTVEWEQVEGHGDRINPPDYDEGMVVIAVDGVPVVNKFDSYGERDNAMPLCEECEKHGGPDTRGCKPNTADYLIPVSDDQGKTVKRWKFICSWHRGSGDHGDYDDWRGPSIRISQDAPHLPWVNRPENN
jgi:hypothetical protein